MTDAPLERALTTLAAAVDWPEPGNDLAPRVVARITAPEHLPFRRRRHAVRYAAAVAAVLAGVLVLSPPVRHAVADMLEAAGVRLNLIEAVPQLGGDLDLGAQVTLDEAVGSARFALRAPEGGELGPADVVYRSDVGVIAMVWEGSPLLPAAPGSDVALLLMQSPGSLTWGQKGVGPDSAVRVVTVEGVDGLWLEGAPHTFTLLDERGEPVEETARLAANVLLWEVDGINYRLETAGDLDSALAVVDRLEQVR
jgi:hypothetical protein